MLYPRLSNLPPLVRTFIYVHHAFVVGSYAAYILGDIDEEPKDIDLIVPLSNWSEAMKSIPKGSPTNTFGGVKVPISHIGSSLLNCDIWSQDLSEFLMNNTSNYPILHPKTNTTLRVAIGIKKSVLTARGDKEDS